jgi:hypothetical protein
MTYLDGNSFKNICYYQYDENGFNVNHDGKENFIFVKTDFIFDFFSLYNIGFDFYLVTHNSDYGIDDKYLNVLSHPNLIKWYAQNVNIDHSKLSPIPIGLANDRWAHGNKKIFNEINNNNSIQKNIICYANFDINTNITERKNCLDNIPQEFIYPKTDFQSYLTQLKSSLFTVSPEGNGIDCHKTWEALYLKTIPIVKKSILTWKFYQMNIPLILIDDWEELKNIKLDIDLYQSIMEQTNFETTNININYFTL